MRRDAGLTAKEVAGRAGWYPSKASRLENAVTGVELRRTSLSTARTPS
ncbi:helix-turn-helix domain-containing protein [Streptomyces sp. NPDC001262]